MDAFTQQAMGVLTSSKLAYAMNLRRRTPNSNVTARVTRRISATAPRATTRTSSWLVAWLRPARCAHWSLDFYSKFTCKSGVNGHAPIFDQGLAALIEICTSVGWTRTSA